MCKCVHMCMHECECVCEREKKGGEAVEKGWIQRQSVIEYG
jgi:hypothetical protein